MSGAPWRWPLSFVAAWATPALLLSVAAALIAEGRGGLWLALLFVVAPLFASLTVSVRPPTPPGDAGALPLGASLLVVGLIVWANLSLAGDVASWMGWPRWGGIVLAAAGLAVVLWPAGSRCWPWLVLTGLVALLVPLVVVGAASRSGPLATWAHVASQRAFRFPAGSPWVTEGRVVEARRGTLAFEEEHRLTPVDPGPLRVEVSDQGRVQVQEWTLTPGQSVTLRPGDRLQLERPRRLRFEADKRIPGAPASGIAWADAALAGRSLSPLRILGLGVTLLGGAVALAGVGGAAVAARSGVALAGVVLLALLGWAECWTIYALHWAPEVYLGGVTAAPLLELPALALRGGPWGPQLAALTLVGLFALFLAGFAALRGEHGTLGPAARLGGGILVLAALAALWPLPPPSLMLGALGLGASTVGPLVLAGTPAGRQRAATGALWVGLAVFVGLSTVGRLGVSADSVTEALADYPALVAAPLVAGILLVARRPARA